MIVIRRFIIVVATLALLGGATACSALLGSPRDHAVADRVAELTGVMGAEEARPLDVPELLTINGVKKENDGGFGTYYATFSDDCWTTVVFGRINEESGELETGWADQMPDFEAEDGYGQLPIDDIDDMAAFAAESCTNSAVTPDSP